MLGFRFASQVDPLGYVVFSLVGLKRTTLRVKGLGLCLFRWRGVGGRGVTATEGAVRELAFHRGPS